MPLDFGAIMGLLAKDEVNLAEVFEVTLVPFLPDMSEKDLHQLRALMDKHVQTELDRRCNVIDAEVIAETISVEAAKE